MADEYPGTVYIPFRGNGDSNFDRTGDVSLNRRWGIVWQHCVLYSRPHHIGGNVLKEGFRPRWYLLRSRLRSYCALALRNIRIVQYRDDGHGGFL